MQFDTDIEKCIDVLKNSGTILYPTDTIWGVGCDAASEKAVAKVFSIKKRSKYKSLIVLVSDIKMLTCYVKEIPSVAYNLIRESVKPLTIIYESGILLAENIFAEDGSVGIRVVNSSKGMAHNNKDDFCKRLIYKFGKPIVSTSANISGDSVAPRNFSEIPEEIKKKVNYVVKWRQNERKINQPSGIIKLKKNGEFRIIRRG